MTSDFSLELLSGQNLREGRTQTRPPEGSCGCPFLTKNGQVFGGDLLEVGFPIPFFSTIVLFKNQISVSGCWVDFQKEGCLERMGKVPLHWRTGTVATTPKLDDVRYLDDKRAELKPLTQLGPSQVAASSLRLGRRPHPCPEH